MAAFYDSRAGDIIVIDEPELSLHPAYQKRLMQVICEFAKDRQVIISTHSPYMIDTISICNGAELCRTWELPHGTEIKQIDEQSRHAWQKLTGKNLFNPHQFGIDAKEVFFLEDGVLVVEGQEDVTLFPELVSILQLNVGATLFGWGAGGASNIKYVLRILHDLGYRKVASLYDGDKPDEASEVEAMFPDYLVARLPFDDIRTKEAREIAFKEGLFSSTGKLLPDKGNAVKPLVEKLSAYFLT